VGWSINDDERGCYEVIDARPYRLEKVLNASRIGVTLAEIMATATGFSDGENGSHTLA